MVQPHTAGSVDRRVGNRDRARWDGGNYRNHDGNRRVWNGTPGGVPNSTGSRDGGRRDRDGDRSWTTRDKHDRNRDGDRSWTTKDGHDRNRDGDRSWTERDRRYWNRDGDRSWTDRNRRDWNRDGNRSWSTDRNSWSRHDNRDWNRNWRSDRRYNWRDYRSRHRHIYRLPRYESRYGYSYRRWYPGYRWDPWFYSSTFWISDPWYYRLPPAYGPYRWVRYHDDAVLVDIETGEIIDIIYDFFW